MTPRRQSQARVSKPLLLALVLAGLLIVVALAVAATVLLDDRQPPRAATLDYCADLTFLPCPRQALVLSHPLAGSNFVLTYASDRVPGRTAAPVLGSGPVGLAGWSLDAVHSYDPAARLFVLGTGERRLVEPVTLQVGGETRLAIASVTGEEVHVFDTTGRHLETRHGISGAVMRALSWTDAGLEAISEPGGRRTSVLRDGDGTPTALLTASGYRTRLGVRDGWLAAIVDPDDRLTVIETSGEGLVTALTDAAGGTSTYEYDDAGRLTRRAPAGGTWTTWQRSELDDGFTVSATTAGDRTSVHSLRMTGQSVIQSYRDASGATTTVTVNGTNRLVTNPDGSTLAITLAADPRWGMSAPAYEELVFRTAGERELRITETRTVTEGSGFDAAHARELVVDAATSRLVFDPASRTATLTEPGGSAHSIVFDADGLIVGEQRTGGAPISYLYTAGRMVQVAIGEGADARRWAIESDSATGDVTMTDPLGQRTTLHFDVAGRQVGTTLPDGTVARLERDELGRVVAVGPPGRTASLIVYRPDGLIELSAAPPGEGPAQFTSFRRDADGLLAGLQHADASGVTIERDEAGRVVAISSGVASWTINRDSAGWLTAIDGPLDLAVELDADALVAERWSGPLEASVVRELDAAGRVVSVAVNGNEALDYVYDDAGRLVGAAGATIAYDEAGRVAQELIGAVTRRWRYNGFGEPAGVTVSAGETLIYELSLERDGLGRVIHRTERLADGTERTRTFTYDAAGRLASASDDGATTNYEYDQAGNLVRERLSDGRVIESRYDGRDALIERDGVAYSYDAAGRLSSAGAATYRHDGGGHLLGASTGAGSEVEYLVDGLGRRVGRLVEGGLVEVFAYLDELRPAAQLGGDGNVAAQFAYGLPMRTPSYVLRGEDVLLVVVDETGSPRLVVDTGSGRVVEELAHDAWGRAATNSQLLPFGFAGGLVDPDTGLLHFGARDYDPASTRWLAPDPLGAASGDANLYRYAAGDPVNKIDPGGLWPCDLTTIGVSGSAGGGGFGGSFGYGVILGNKGGAGIYVSRGVSQGTSLGVSTGVGVSIGCAREESQSKSAQEQLEKAGGSGASTDIGGGPFSGGADVGVDDNGKPSTTGGHLGIGSPSAPFVQQTATNTTVLCLSCVADALTPDRDPPDDGRDDENACRAGPACETQEERAAREADKLLNPPGPKSIGDPHLLGANGVSFSFQAVGEFVLLQSDSGDLVVQARQQAVRGSRWASITTAVALKVGNERLTFELTAAGLLGRLNGVPIEAPAQASGRLELANGGELLTQGRTQVVRWPDGTLLVIDPGRVLNLAFGLEPERSGTLRGLLGPYLSEVTGLAETRAGEPLDAEALNDYDTRYRTFGDSWRIGDDESLFDYSAGESTATFTDLAFPDPQPWSPSDAHLAAAEAACQRLAVPANALPGCIFDVAETGDPGWAVTTASFLAGFRPTLAGVQALPLAAPPGERLTVLQVAIGDTVSGEIDVPNERHVYELDGAAGDVIYLRAVEPCDEGRLIWQLRHPSGEWMGGGIPDACADFGRAAFDVDGIYRIEISSLRGTPGGYSFEVAAAEDEPVRPIAVGDTVSGRIELAGEQHEYELTARAGEVIYLRAIEPCEPSRLLWRLFTPAGADLGGLPDTCLDMGRIEFPADGSYRLRVGSLSDGTGAYAFEVLASVPTQVRPVAIGDRVSGRIELPGERHAYELPGRAGDALYLRAGDSCERSLLWWLLNPEGVAVHGGIPDTCLDIGRVELSADGIYRIEIWSLSDGTGPYEFTVERQ